MKPQGKAVEFVSTLRRIPMFVWILAGITIFFVYAVVSGEDASSAKDQPTARLIGPKSFAHREVLRAEFRAEVRQAQAQIVMRNDDLFAYWKKYLERADCDDVQSKGYSSEPVCIQKEAYRKEILERGICNKGQSTEPCE